MTNKVTIQAETRDCFGKNEMNRLRRSGRVPGVVYGRGEESVPVSLDQKELTRLLEGITFENTIINLQITGKVTKSHQTLIREIQRHPFKSQIEHLDFYCVSTDRRIHVEVPIVLHGTPEGVRSQGGLVQHVMRDLMISVLPADIPEQVVVDITVLKVGESLHIKDVPAGNYEILNEMDQTVVTVVPPTVVKAAAEVVEGVEGEVVGEAEVEEEEEVKEPEVISRRKESEEK